MLESARLTHLLELDHRPEAVPRARAGDAARVFSLHALRRSPAAATADIVAARALDPTRTSAQGGMPRLAAAFAAGEISKEHVTVAVATREAIPNKFTAMPAEDLAREPVPEDAGKCGGDLIDENLTANARAHPPFLARRLANSLLDTLDPERRRRYDEKAHERRTVSSVVDSTGMLIGRFALDPANGLPLAAVLAVLSAPRPPREETAEDGSGVTITDTRTTAQRKADALGETARRAARTLTDPLAHPDRPFDAPTDDPAQPTPPTPPAQSTELTELTEPTTDQASPATLASPATPAGPAAEEPSAEGPANEATAHPADDTAAPSATPTLAHPTDDLATQRVPMPTQRVPPAPEATGNTVRSDATPPDTRPPTAPGVPSQRGPRAFTPRILITATADQITAAQQTRPGDPPVAAGMAEAQQYGPIPASFLRTQLCDATLQRVLLARNGAVLNLGRELRTVSIGQKTALTARDGGCVIPGCTLPASWCDAHHVTPWSRGGPSDTGNYALLCPSHHNQVHLDIWKIVMIDGIPWARPPAWIDARRRLIRNTYRDHDRQARLLGERLRLALDHPHHPAPAVDARSPQPPRTGTGPTRPGPGHSTRPTTGPPTRMASTEESVTPHQPMPPGPPRETTAPTSPQHPAPPPRTCLPPTTRGNRPYEPTAPPSLRQRSGRPHPTARGNRPRELQRPRPSPAQSTLPAHHERRPPLRVPGPRPTKATGSRIPA